MAINPVLLVIGWALSFFMAWNLGANDAATPCNAPVGAGAISVRKALIIFSVFAAIGAIAQGYMNIKTISGGIVPRIDPFGAITITLTACVWSFFCTWKGLEISNTYTIVGSILGYAILVYNSFDSRVIFNILASWVTSPIISIVLSYPLYKLMMKLFHNFLNNERFVKVVSFFLIISLCFSAYSFGANDVGNATGVYVSVTQEMAGLPDFTTMLLLAAFGALGITAGGLTWRSRVIETVAFKIVRLDVLSGLVAETTNAIVLYLFVTVPYIFLGFGLPVSSSIVGVGALIGTGLARGHGMVDMGTVGRLILTWVITIPATAVISAILYYALSRFLIVI